MSVRTFKSINLFYLVSTTEKTFSVKSLRVIYQGHLYVVSVSIWFQFASMCHKVQEYPETCQKGDFDRYSCDFDSCLVGKETIPMVLITTILKRCYFARRFYLFTVVRVEVLGSSRPFTTDLQQTWSITYTFLL